MEKLAPGIFAETNFIGVNVGAVSTPQGIIALDAPSFPRDARSWAMTLHRTHHFAVIYTVLTDYQGERTLNTRWLNAPTIAHNITADQLHNYDKRYPALLLEGLSQRYPERSRELSSSPVERPVISFDETLILFKGGREVALTAVPGPTSANIWLHVPDANVLFVGDTLTVGSHPLLHQAHTAQWLASLDRLEALAPSLLTIVPGHGPLCDGAAIDPVRQYILAMRATIAQHIQEERAAEETAVYISEFLSYFPHNDAPLDWLKRQIKLSLDRVYVELKLEAATIKTNP